VSIVRHDATRRYDRVAPRWGDKMCTLGYCDAYVGFFAASPESVPGARVIDIGAGTAAFAEAWVVVHGRPGSLTLLDPSRSMLERGDAALRRHGVEPVLAEARLGATGPDEADVALAAHVLEHCPDPAAALGQMRDLLRPGGRLWLVVSKPHWCNAIVWLQWRHRTFGRDEIRDLLAGAGFRVERVHAFPDGPPSRTSRGIVATRSG